MSGSVSSTSSTSTTPATSTAVNAAASLGKDDFLKLLITQLQYQDPMQPMEDKDFIAQMAQFNSLEAMQNLNTTMSGQADFAKLTEASTLIGRNVSIKNKDDSVVTGTVEEVRRVDSVVKVMVKTVPAPGEADQPAQPYDLDTIQQVAP